MQRSGRRNPASGCRKTAEAEGRVASAELAAVDRLVRDAVIGAGAKRAVVDPLAGLHDPRDVEQLFASLRFEVAPQLVCAADERDVARVLEVREPDDAGSPVRRAHVVGYVVALDPEHALASAGEMVEGSTPHPADSDHDDVVPLHWPILDSVSPSVSDTDFCQEESVPMVCLTIHTDLTNTRAEVRRARAGTCLTADVRTRHDTPGV